MANLLHSEELLEPLRVPDYFERPAFVALSGCIAGILAFNTPRVLLWCAVLAIIGGILLGLSFLKVSFSNKWMKRSIDAFRTAGIICLIGSAFGLYAAERGQTALTFPDKLRLENCHLEVLYPVSSHASSPAQYAVRADVKGETLTLLLRPSDGKKLAKEYGSTLTADLSLQSIATGRSYYRYLLSEGYDASGYFTPISPVCKSACPTLSSRLQELREKLVRRFIHRSEGIVTKEEAGLIFALSLGDRSRLPESDREDFANSGLAHVMAVSGYHLGIIFVLLGFVINRLVWKHEYRAMRYLLLFAGLLFYTLLSGASTATVRALVMSGTLLLGRALGRRTDIVQVLSLTMLLFLIAQPFSYLSVGLLLSIAAVWGILSFLPLFQRILTPSLWPLKHFRDAFFVTVSAQLALIPFLFLFFQRIQLSIFWSNIPIVLLSSVLIPLGFMLILLTPLLGNFIPDFIYALTGKLAEGVLGIIRYFGSPGLSLTVRGDWDVAQVLLYYIAIFLIYKISVDLLNRKLSYQK